MSPLRSLLASPPTHHTLRPRSTSARGAQSRPRAFVARSLPWSVGLLGLALEAQLPLAAQDFAVTPLAVPAAARSAGLRMPPRLLSSSQAALSVQDQARELASLDMDARPVTWQEPPRLAQAAGPTSAGPTSGGQSLSAGQNSSERAVVDAPAAASEAEAAAPSAEAKLGPGRTRVLAGHVSKQGSVLTVEGDEGGLVVVESGDMDAGGARVQAQRVTVNLDPNAQTLSASGQVRLERSRPVSRSSYSFERVVRRDASGRPLSRNSSASATGHGAGAASGAASTSSSTAGGDSSSPASPSRAQSPERRGQRQQFFTEVLVGNNLTFDGKTRRGSLDGAQLQLSALDVAAASILIEGGDYHASQVVLRPGGLSDAERKIYGTPPLSLRARAVDVIFSGDKNRSGHIVVRHAGLYFHNTRLLPVPLQVLAPFSLVRLGPSRGASTFSVVPSVSLNSTDRFLLATRIAFPLGGFPRAAGLDGQAKSPKAGVGEQRARRRSGSSVLNLDVGVSGRLGFRGGAALENRSPLGLISLQARRADVVTTQLTNQLVVNRTPELAFSSPLLPVLSLSSGRGVDAFVSASAGELSERIVDSDRRGVASSRVSGTVGLTTRVDERAGLYADVFATRSRYGLGGLTYSNTGFEIGYLGRLLPQVRGLFSLRHVSLSGATPFQFDTIEIPRELRTTFDIQATPRFLIPIDLRYDLDRRVLRDKSVGVLRNYKTFAYGLVYQTARRDLRLELRSSF